MPLPTHPPFRRGALLLAVTLLSACGTAVVNPVTGQTERTVMTEQDEIAEGKKAHAEVMKQYGAVDDPKLQAYVREVGLKLAKQSQRPNLPWTVTVLDSAEINAFALPGGYVYVTRGIMAYLDSEADLAGVLGHEIGHVTARHGAQRATRQQHAGIAAVLGTVLGVVAEGMGVAGAAQTAGQLSQAAAAGYVASYSREQESQADELGAAYLAKLGYNPQNMVDVIQVLKNQERFAIDQAKAAGQPVPEGNNWLASHPSNDKRLADITRIAAAYQGQYGDDQRKRYQQAIDGMNFGDSADQGVVRGRNFYHEGLGVAITAPPGWKIQNSPQAIAFVSPQGDAGLVVRTVPADAGRDPDEILRKVVKPVDGKLQRDTINGLPIARFAGTVADAQGQRASVRLSIVSGPHSQNYLLQHAAKDAASLQRATQGLAAAENSFRPLSASEKQAARPWVLRTVSLPAGGFAELARQSPLGANAEAQLRLLNGVYAGGREIRAGERVRVVQ